jgi:hypothetical protein
MERGRDGEPALTPNPDNKNPVLKTFPMGWVATKKVPGLNLKKAQGLTPKKTTFLDSGLGVSRPDGPGRVEPLTCPNELPSRQRSSRGSEK